MRVGDLIRIKREAMGMSANALSLAAGLSKSYVAKLENGLIAEPSLSAFSKIAMALELNYLEVFVMVKSV